MKKLLVLLLFAAAAGAAAWFLVVAPRLGDGAGGASTQVNVLQKAPWEPYGYELRPGPNTRSYDLAAVITLQGTAPPNVRILLDVQDPPTDYHFVELTANRTRIGKVEGGLETPLGTSQPVGLASQGDNRVVVKRRYDAIQVVLNDQLVAGTEGDLFQGARLGAGVLDRSATVKLARPQPCDPVYFADDFMKGASEGGGWTTASGSWHVATLRNPSLSSNAFYYVASAPSGGPPATSVRGEWFWDNYRFRAAAVSFGREDMGLYVYYRDPNNYYLFRWNAESQPDGQRGRKQLVKRWHGQETVLAEAPGGYQPRVWYQIDVEAVGTRLRALIDGHEILSVTDANLCFGQVGFYSANAVPVESHFDDVLVQTVRSFEDDFSAEAAGRWRPLGGSWEPRHEGGRHSCLVATDLPAKAVAGSSRWRDYTFAAALRLPPRLIPPSEVGLVGHYLDETNYVVFAWRPAAGSARLMAMVEGEMVAQEQVAADKGLPNTVHLASLTWQDGTVTASLDGQPVASAWVPGLPRGKVGLYASEVTGLAFESARASFPLPPEPVLTTHEVFSHELSMEIWAGAANDWESTYETLDGRSTQVQWHRADFPGDTTMEIELKGDAAKAAAGGSGPRACRLVLSAESGKGTATGYSLSFRWPEAPGDTTLKAILARGDATLAQRDVKLEHPARRLRFQRIGNTLIASVNEDPLLAARDPQPLDGQRAAFATHRLPVAREHVSVFSDNVKVYTFSRAATDWRPAAGTWEISNRWECDPRWSFFSGVPDGSSLAAIWNKYLFEGDVTVEFAVGPKMDSSRGGGNYQYARDFNVTICGDGKDLTKGYTFLFGGWDNTATAITRDAKAVAKSGSVIPRSSGIHRRWFYVKVEKRGPKLRYWIDGSQVLTYTDPDPLPGNRIAIWSWDCGLMVSRVRIGASAIKGTEPPGTPSATPRTIYSPTP